MMLRFIISLLLSVAVHAAIIPTLIETGNATVSEPDPNCPMVGIDCLFNDIERAANVG